MKRRSAVKSIIFFSLAGSTLLSCEKESQAWAMIRFDRIKLSSHQQQLLESLAYTILPIQKVKGWESIALAPVAMQLIDFCYAETEIEIFFEGLKSIDKKARLEYHKPFLSCTEKEKLKMVISWSQNEKAHGAESKTIALFKKELLHSLTTTEDYLRKYKMYEMAPARYKACIPTELVTTLPR
ncbi:MAG: gluconate 2-dehydrogenase subunit 3 family protein [Saprospiraceae bacterium]|nr:gluconate 2-dehydrogenase subunit 3 family protein [Saprospiraceae bacterium]